MWRSLIVLLLLATPAWAQENATAYEALRVVGTELGRGALDHIVTMTGVKGDPQPEKWKIILEDPEGRGVLRERLIPLIDPIARRPVLPKAQRSMFHG